MSSTKIKYFKGFVAALASLLALQLMSCSTADFGAGAIEAAKPEPEPEPDSDDVVLDDDERNSGDVTVNGDGDDPDIRDTTSKATLSKRAAITIVDAQTEAAKDDPVEFLFLVDDSPSMIDNRAKLEEASGDLFEGLLAAKLPYRARILPLSTYVAGSEALIQDVTGRDLAATPGLFEGLQPVWDLPADQMEKYINVASYDQTSNANDASTTIGSAGGDLFASETGVCAATDFINRVSFANNAALPKFDEDTKLHVVVLSDENNDPTIKTYNENDGSLLSEKRLVCHRDAAYDSDCHEVWRWRVYGYTKVTPGTTRYRWAYTYKNPSDCQRRDFADFPNGTDDRYTLTAPAQCRKQNKRCKRRGTAYTRYRCEAAGIVKFQNNNPITNRGACEIAQNYECEQLVDGNKVYKDKTRAEALAIMGDASLGLACRIKANTATTWNDNVNPGSALYNTGDDFNAEGYRKCEAFACDGGSTIQPYVNINVSPADYDPNLHFARGGGENVCTDLQTWTTWKFRAHDGAHGKLASVSEATCASRGSGYQDYNVAGPIGYSDEFCASNPAIDVAVAAHGLTKVAASASAVASNGSGNTAWSTTSKTQAQAKAEIVAALEAQYPHITNIGDYVVMAANQQVDPGNDVTEEEFYIYPRYDGNAAWTPIPNSDPRVGDFGALAANARLMAPYPIDGGLTTRLAENNALFGQHVQITYEPPMGSNTPPDQCKKPELVEKLYDPTPENFQQLMKDLHPKMQYTWHAIVNQDGQPCAGTMENLVTKGTDYIKLAEETSGLVEDICKPDFVKFIRDLTIKVITEVVLKYALPADVDPSKITGVQIKGESGLLQESAYEIVDNDIIFAKDAVEKDQVVEVIYDP